MSSYFFEPLTLEDDALNLCPYCHGNNLHHEGVTVYDRNEDAEKVRVTHVTDMVVSVATVDEAHSNNPSPRRTGLTIDFSCETCEEKPVMAIIQHKGTTYIGWKK
jgi:hypothetical protein